MATCHCPICDAPDERCDHGVNVSATDCPDCLLLIIERREEEIAELRASIAEMERAP